MVIYRANRKKREGSRWLTLLAAFGVPALALAVLYVALDGRCAALGRQIVQLEKQREHLNRQVRAAESKWASHNTLQQLQAALDRFGIEMSWPDQRRIVHLARALDARDLDAALEPPQFVLQPVRGGNAVP
mgnify:CR=1 FL=1